jgi:hypothetical protein
MVEIRAVRADQEDLAGSAQVAAQGFGHPVAKVTGVLGQKFVIGTEPGQHQCFCGSGVMDLQLVWGINGQQGQFPQGLLHQLRMEIGGTFGSKDRDQPGFALPCLGVPAKQQNKILNPIHLLLYDRAQWYQG